ncbi:hypothetical protein, partial [Cognatilysobacter lacus]|uniref:hypothetical protein n=1 Tax=Cognatilysobacter lacus TaxID=1643323 RepID=UPI0019610686
SQSAAAAADAAASTNAVPASAAEPVQPQAMPTNTADMPVPARTLPGTGPSSSTDLNKPTSDSPKSTVNDTDTK